MKTMEQLLQIAKEIISNPSMAIDASELLQTLRQVLKLNPAVHADLIANFCEACITHYQRNIDLDPQKASSYYSLGNIYAETNRDREAFNYYNQALDLNSNYAEAYFSLGNLAMKQGKDEEAIANFLNAIQLNPDFAKPYVNLAYLYEKQGKLEESLVKLQKATQVNPNFAHAHKNLGSLLVKLDRLEEALISCSRSLALQPDASAYLNLSIVQTRQGNLDEAIATLQTAISIDPYFTECYFRLGMALSLQDKLDEAISYLQKAVNIDPSHTEALFSLGDALAIQGKTMEALANYQALLQGQGKRIEYVKAYRQQHLILPILYENEAEVDFWRRRFTLALQTIQQETSLETESDRLWALGLISVGTNFYLTYQGQNDLELQKQYGDLVHRVMAANYPKFAPSNLAEASAGASAGAVKLQGQSHKIRIGYLSSYFKVHSVAHVTLGWLKYRDKEIFEVYTYYTGKEIDSLTREFEHQSDLFRHLPNSSNSLEKICTQIIADRLDVLVFAEIGLDPETTKTAALRLAPIQICGFGHPITSGLPTIDYFLSSEVMEPDHAQSYYSEQLVCLPKIGMSYQKISIPASAKNRSNFGLSNDAVVYSCCQSLFKYLPQHDYVFAEIAKQVPKSKFVFYAHYSSAYITQQFRQRLQRAFTKYDLDADLYTVILPRTGRLDYLAQTLVSDVHLDSLEFSGANTTLEAIACNLPVVTLPGKFSRGRLSYGMLKVMGVTDTIAQTEAEYIEIAVRLSWDLQWRKRIAEKMQSRQDILFEDKTCVRAFEEFLKTKVFG